MQAVAEKLMNERNQLTNYGMDFYILSIPNKASVYPEFMPDTIETKDINIKDRFINEVFGREYGFKCRGCKANTYKS